MARRGADGLDTVDRRTQITRLGQDLAGGNGELSPAAIDRTVSAVRDFSSNWRDRGVVRVGITATSAARDATNAETFLDAVEQVAGVRPQVLSGPEEAALAFNGAVSGLPPERRSGRTHLVVDIGGGSTELSRGEQAVATSTSRQMGSVRMTEQFLRGDPPSSEELTQAVAAIDLEIRAAAREVGPRSTDLLIGTAGTVTTLAALNLGLSSFRPEAIHASVMTMADVRRLADLLCAMPVATRASLGPMEPGRADVIAGGALILARLMEQMDLPEILASESDILDGIALSLIS